MLTYEELTKMDPKKMQEELETALRESFKAQLEVKTGQSKANHMIPRWKKYIAQIKTVLNSKR